MFIVFTSVVTHMLPEMSIQKMTIASSTPETPPNAPPPSTVAGVMRKVVSSLDGFSSSTMSTSLELPQNSHTHSCEIERDNTVHVRVCPCEWGTRAWEELINQKRYLPHNPSSQGWAPRCPTYGINTLYEYPIL